MALFFIMTQLRRTFVRGFGKLSTSVQAASETLLTMIMMTSSTGPSRRENPWLLKRLQIFAPRMNSELLAAFAQAMQREQGILNRIYTWRLMVNSGAST
jgi:hypothetical protein